MHFEDHVGRVIFLLWVGFFWGCAEPQTPLAYVTPFDFTPLSPSFEFQTHLERRVPLGFSCGSRKTERLHSSSSRHVHTDLHGGVSVRLVSQMLTDLLADG